MYINFDLLKKKEITTTQLLVLQIIKQKEYERLEGLGNIMNKLFKKGLVMVIKGSKKQLSYEKARLTKTGKEFLNQVEVPEVTEEAIKLTDDLRNLWIDEGKEVGSQLKILKLVSWYLSETGHNPADIYETVADVSKDWFLHNLIFKAPNYHVTRKDLSESYLYSLMLKD